MNEKVEPFELKERMRHRLKAHLKDSGLKCIRELRTEKGATARL